MEPQQVQTVEFQQLSTDPIDVENIDGTLLFQEWSIRSIQTTKQVQEEATLANQYVFNTDFGFQQHGNFFEIPNTTQDIGGYNS